MATTCRRFAAETTEEGIVFGFPHDFPMPPSFPCRFRVFPWLTRDGPLGDLASLREPRPRWVNRNGGPPRSKLRPS